jgi:hypothetical protein
VRIPLQPVRFSGTGDPWFDTAMTTLLIPATAEAEAQTETSTPGCGCCVPPPDSVDRRVAELLDRRERLERKLLRLT